MLPRAHRSFAFPLQKFLAVLIVILYMEKIYDRSQFVEKIHKKVFQLLFNPSFSSTGQFDKYCANYLSRVPHRQIQRVDKSTLIIIEWLEGEPDHRLAE